MLKRLFLLFFLLLLIAVIAGYFCGLRPNTIQAFWTEINSRMFANKDTAPTPPDTVASATIPSKSKKKTKSTKAPANEVLEFQPLPTNPFAGIDKHARSCPKSEEKSIKALAAYLKQNTTSDLEMARAIYVWLAKNIRYDDAGFNGNLDGDYSAEGVLKSRKAVCEGFSNLYYALGKQMNLPIEKVVGYAKGYGYAIGQQLSETNHAWNIIKINGQWRVFDATWGEGNGTNVKGKLVSKKEFDNYWFNVNPYEAIFTHLPENKNFQCVQPTIDLKTYESLPYLERAFFELGFDGTATYRNVYNNKSLQFPTCYPAPTPIKIISAPRYKAVELNKPVSFELYIPRGISVVAIDSKNNWTYFNRDKGKFTLTYTPTEPGELSISIKYEKGGNSYYTVVTYLVKATNANA